MNLAMRFRLSLMMFFNFFIWGAWFVTMGTYLTSIPGIKELDVANAYGTQSWGAILAPFIIGLIADKFFAAQKILGLLHLLGGALLYYLTTLTDFSAFFPVLLVYMILFMPTLALVNTVSFNQVKNAEKDFSNIRVWGTIGWIVAGVLISWLAWEKTGSLVNTFRMASGVSIVTGLYCFTLPNTPPARKGTTTSFREIVGADALMLLKDRNFLVFFLASMFICIPLAFYYQETNIFLNEIKVEGAAGKMALGQASEMIFLLVMPFFFRRSGLKNMLLIGMAAWVLRYLCFGFGNTGSGMWLLYAGIILHGVCYDFFFVTGQVYTNKRAGETIRSSAQGMITLATYGVGMLIGFWIAGLVANKYALPGGGHDWKSIWIIPAIIAAAVFVLYALLFKDQGRSEVSEVEGEKGLATSPVT